MSAFLSPRQLRRGDVLLSLGRGRLSELIHFLNGGKYSHGSIYDGECVLECVAEGVRRHTLPELFSHREFVDVYRFKSDDSARLEDPDWSAQPIIDVGLTYLQQGTKYAYHQLLMMGLLITTRRAPLPAVFHTAVRSRLDKAVKLLADMMDGGVEPLTCSEFVYKCFYEAAPRPRYGLTVPGVDEPGDFFGAVRSSQSAAEFEFQAMGTVSDEEAIRLLTDAFAQRYAAIKPELGEDFAAGGSGESAFEFQRANPNVISDFVSPGDSERSPNLERLGELAISNVAGV